MMLPTENKPRNLISIPKNSNENYDDFIVHVKNNPLSVAVKLNDLTDNMDILVSPI